MQKKIIALAIASALTAPAVAMADSVGNVTLYGQANVSVDIVNDGATASASTNQLVSNASRVGVKGSEDLGGGLTAMFQAEKEVNVDDGTAPAGAFFDRNTFIGLSSADMGTVLFGNHDTPYKISTRGLDVFADTKAADNRVLMGNGVHDARLGNVIAYISPAMSGLTVAAASVFGAESAINGQTKGGALSVAGMYDQGPIFATLAYQNIKAGHVGTGLLAGFGGAVTDENKAFKLGGSYTMDAFKVNAVFEKVTNTVKLTANETTNNNVYVAGKYSLSATDAVKLAYTKNGDSNSSVTGKATDNHTRVAVGYDHDMSKRTTVYALYNKHTDNSTLGADPSTVSFGLKHAF